ncbi:MAG: class I SAM-dependent methyltransferase [Chloroflexota bacterium]
MTESELLVQLPDDVRNLSQDEEFFFVTQDGNRRKIRFHDYGEIYKIPGLYEHLFYERLKCNSPRVISSLLADRVDQTDNTISDLVVLDLGAGNGMVGETLRQQGVKEVIGIDIVPEAAEAAKRDRPDVYSSYYVEDLCNLPNKVQDSLESTPFNCLSCVAALGFGDIPPEAFAQGYNFIADDGWVAFSIKEDFVHAHDESGFAGLIERTVSDGRLDILVKQPYQHRLAIDGQPLYYMAIVGQKRADIPAEFVF